jgi:hypothetical protein
MDDDSAQVIHFNHATWMAQRVQFAEQVQVPAVEHVVLPGAFAALPIEKANAYLRAGLDGGQIAQRVNDNWRVQNAERLRNQAAWASGPYSQALAMLAQEKAQAAAVELQRRARFEALTKALPTV